MIETVILDSPLGSMEIKGDVFGITSVTFLDEKIPATTIENSAPVLKKAYEQLLEFFEGTRTEFDLKLNPQGTDFQKKVWTALSTIPYGKTFTYMDMAKQLGDPKVIRAAASANGKNPINIIIPCHRVIGTDHSLTGYAGGLWRKKWLLEHESPVRQTALF
ncbi:MAG TPA: methylated-DNA--[protein]-cysteine S-methyltransferase [Leeuwenhoekiella sp.]|nr:methylated-DNA--[protein]-cysteine S-methyltransferase [Leeuwenhoekiella sp.]